MWPEDTGSTPSAAGSGSRPGAPAVLVFVIVFAAYTAGAVASALAFGSTTASAFYVPGGITVAALLLTRRSRWPAVVAALFLAELLVDRVSGLNWAVSAGFALGNAVEALVGAGLVRACCGGTPDLRRTRDLTAYVVGAAGVGALCGALIGGVTKARGFGVPLAPAVTQWFAGDFISVLVVGSSILLWRAQSALLKSRPVETAAILAAAAAASFVGFGTPIPPGTTVLPVLAVAALRLGMLGTALTGVVVAAVGNYLTGTHQGLIGEADTADPIRVAMAQSFVAVLVLTAMVIAQEVAKRTSAVLERDDERGQRLRLESLSELARRLAVALTPDDVGRALEARLPEDLGAQSFRLALLDQDGRLQFTGGAVPGETSIATAAARSAEPVVSGALAAWPLLSGERTTGVLLLGFPEPPAFDAEQQTYTSAVAAMVGEALGRARSFAGEQARAAVLHAALHPASPPTTPGVTYRVCYEPADTVHGLGGDFYDVLPLPGGRTYLAVGDILGHGLQAVEDMAQLRSAGRTLAHRGQSPAQVLTDLNGFTADVIRGEFATMVIAIVDPATGMLTFSSAGHPPMLLRKTGTGRVVRLRDANGPVLGPVRTADYRDGVVALAPGDQLMMYTDGLVERPGLVVSAGISCAAQRFAEWPAGELPDPGVLTDTLAPPPRSDDTCVLVVQVD